MPPRRASTGPKKKIVKAVRSTRKSAAAAVATPAKAEIPDAVAEAEIPTAAPDAETLAVEAVGEISTPQNSDSLIAAAEIVADGVAGENPTSENPDPTEAHAEPEAPVPETRFAAVAVVDEMGTVTDEAKTVAESSVPGITTLTSEAQPDVQVSGPETGPGSAKGSEEHVIEPANATETAAEISGAVLAGKRTTKKVRKVVTRRVAVKKMPNKKEPETTNVREKGEGGGEEAAVPPPTLEGERNSDGVEAVAMSVEEVTSTGTKGVTMSVEAQKSSEAGTLRSPLLEQKLVRCTRLPPAVGEPARHVEATSSAVALVDGAQPDLTPKKRVRKVKKIVVVRRPVKTKELSKNEENVEKSDLVSEAVGSTLVDTNASEPSKANENAMKKDVSISDVSLGMPGENVLPNLHWDDAKKSNSIKSIDTEQKKVEGTGIDSGTPDDQIMGTSERQKRRKTEIFIGGLDRNAKEDDVRKAFEKVGEIVEIRMMMDNKTGKNKGYAFLRYATSTQAKQAVSDFAKVEICGKQCGAAALEGNDTIFLGNIDKKWKKDDISNLLQNIGVEKIDTVTLMLDPKNTDCNRGFAFLDFETNKDAQAAFKKLQKKDAFGKGRNVKVAWAEPLADPDEEEMQKVKSLFAEGIPSSWDEEKVKEHFKKFGQIERVVLSRNMHSAKRKDFAFVNFTTREAAFSCIETFDKETADNDSKVSIRVSWAKPVQKNKQSKSGYKTSGLERSKVKTEAVSYDTKANIHAKSHLSRSTCVNIGEDKSSTTRELLHVLREQAAWKQSYLTDAAVPDRGGALYGRKRPLTMGNDPFYADTVRYARARLDSAYPVAVPSYSSLSHNVAGTSDNYGQSSVAYQTGSTYGAVDASITFQMKPGSGAYGGGMRYR